MKNKTIFFVGGGTLGAVAPALAVAEEIKKEHKEVKIIFVGTASGLEGRVIKNLGYVFLTLPISKLPRYFTWKLLIMPFSFILAILKSIYFVIKFRPSVIFGCGGFSQVPVMSAGFCFGAKLAVHQQDVKPTLSNVLISPIARLLSVSFPESLEQLPKGLIHQDRILTGNPIWENRSSSQAEEQFLSSLDYKPLVVILGGSSGASFLNQFTQEYKDKILTKFNLITNSGLIDKTQGSQVGYFSAPFLHDMESIYAKATLIVSRAGMSTISELAHYAKPAILVPIPQTHQEQNANLLLTKGASLVVEQKAGMDFLFSQIESLATDKIQQETLSSKIKLLLPENASWKIAQALTNLL